MIQHQPVAVETHDGTYTHPDVFAAAEAGVPWADPNPDPTVTDWTTRRAEAAVPFALVDGRPVAPNAPTGIRYGRNQLGHWGEARTADALVTAYLDGRRHILMVLRGDRQCAALPGGGIDDGETSRDAALRELAEETGLLVLDEEAMIVTGRARVVDDPRGSDEAWMTTTVTYVDLGDVPELPTVAGDDDATDAAWIDVDYGDVNDVQRLVGRKWKTVVFPAHVAILAAYLDDGPETGARREILAARLTGYDEGFADAVNEGRLPAVLDVDDATEAVMAEVRTAAILAPHVAGGCVTRRAIEAAAAVLGADADDVIELLEDREILDSDARDPDTYGVRATSVGEILDWIGVTVAGGHDLRQARHGLAAELEPLVRRQQFGTDRDARVGADVLRAAAALVADHTELLTASLPEAFRTDPNRTAVTNREPLLDLIPRVSEALTDALTDADRSSMAAAPLL